MSSVRIQRMSSANGETHIREFHDYACRNGFSEDFFLSAGNQDKYIETLIDAYREYPLFLQVFDEQYDAKTFSRMISIDLKSREGALIGIASSGSYESILLVEPPGARKPSFLQYVRVADIAAYTLLLKPAMYKLEDFEKFARDQRTPFLDDHTWYIYIFATKTDAQKQGYGRKLMNLMLSYADLHGCRICLETNSLPNVAMYEHFGFRTVSTSVYKDTLEHAVMLYDSGASHES